MNTRSSLFSVFCGCVLIIPSVYATSQTPAATCEDRARSVLAALDAGQYELARADFDQRMLDGLPAAQLQMIWESLPKQVGERVSVGEARSSETKQGSAVVLPLEHSKSWLDLQLNCDNEGKASGLWIRPGKAPVAQAPAAAESELWQERELIVESSGFSLPATLTIPSSGKPEAGVVLVHGSGSHDRDETIGPNKPFRDLAHGLAEQNIAVLRYDKRSLVDPTSFVGKVFTVKEEVVDDAAAALALLARQPELAGQPIFVAGHSLGAMLAPRIAALQPVSGMILLAAPARSLTEIIPQQIRYIAELDGTVSAEEHGSIEQMQALISQIDALGDNDRTDTTLILGAPAAYWLDLRRFDPIEQAIDLQLPLLLLQGQNDYQVTVQDDYQAWVKRAQGTTGFTARSYPGLNHLFMTAGNPPGPGDYEQAGHVDTVVVMSMAEWIKAQH